MLITELRDAYRNANKSSSAPDFSLQLESMKDEVGSTFNWDLCETLTNQVVIFFFDVLECLFRCSTKLTGIKMD